MVIAPGLWVQPNYVRSAYRIQPDPLRMFQRSPETSLRRIAAIEHPSGDEVMQHQLSNGHQSSCQPWNGGLEFRTLAESVPALIFVTDVAGLNVYTNAQYQRYTGLSDDKLLGDQWVRIIHHDDVERVAETWAAKCAAGESYEIKCRFKRLDGEYRWHLVRAEPIKDATGQILRWVGSCTDVHDLITASALITSGQAVLNGLSIAEGFSVQVKDADDNVVFGEDLERLDAEHGDSLVELGDPTMIVATQLETELSKSNLREVRASLAPTIFEERRTKSNESVRHYRTTRVPFNYPDGSVGITTYRVDITPEKEARLALELTAIDHRNRIDTLPIMTWVANELGELIEVNQAWRDHAGIHISSRNDFGEVIAPDLLAAFLDQWAFCVENGEILDTRTVVSDAITRTECERHILALPMAVHHENGERRWYGAMY